MGYLNLINMALSEADKTKDRRIRKKHYMEAAEAAKRICNLVLSTKTSKESREVTHVSIHAFDALARLPDESRRGIQGYYQRVDSLALLKFGARKWDTICSYQSGKSNKNELMRILTSHDHKTLSLLIRIYIAKWKHFDRVFRLLDVCFDVYPPDVLEESKSIDLDLYHKLLEKLSKWKAISHKKKIQEEKEKAKDKKNWKPQIMRFRDYKISPEMERAFDLLGKMTLHDSWFPTEETFRILFKMTVYGDYPASDAERLRAELEGFRFLSSLRSESFLSSSSSSSEPPDLEAIEGAKYWPDLLPKIDPFSNVPEIAPYPYPPLKAANYTLKAWRWTAARNRGVVLPNEPDPADQAWKILNELRVASTPLLIPIEEVDDLAPGAYDLDCRPDEFLYNRALQVCTNVKSKRSLEVALDILEIVQQEGMLLQVSICDSLLTVISTLSSDELERVKNFRKLLLAIQTEIPNLEEIEDYLANNRTVWKTRTKKSKLAKNLVGKLKKEISHFRTGHPELYETYLSEFKFNFDDDNDDDVGSQQQESGNSDDNDSHDDEDESDDDDDSKES